MKKILSFFLVAALLLPLLCGNAIAAEEDEIVAALVRIDAREDFVFRNDLSNSGTGENSPITQDYYLSKYKVTNAQYKAFLDETGHKAPSYWSGGTYPAGKADHPVLNVSYSSAVAYCEWLSAKYEDWNFRLPTEAEWENAAMGTYYGETAVKYPTNVSPSYDSSTCTMTTDFNFNGVIASKLFREYGSDYVVTYIKGDYAGSSETLGECIQISKTGGVTNWANHGGSATKGYFLQTDLYATISAEGGYTTPVGTYPANTLGLYDMAGNCWDLTSSTIVAVNGLEAGVSCYAVRGGSWYATSRSCTFYYRGEGRKDSPSSTVGFRLAADYVGDDAALAEDVATGATYETLSEAMSALGQTGGTLKLLKDLDATSVVVRQGITLDLNGKNIETKYFTCYGTIIDGESGGMGLVKVTEDIHIADGDSFLPIYDRAAGGYRVYQYQVQNLGFKTVENNPNALKVGIRLTLTNEAGYSVLSQTTDASMNVAVNIHLSDMAGSIRYIFRDETIRKYGSVVAADMETNGSSNMAIILNMTGVDSLSTDTQITVTPEVETATGLTGVGNRVSWTQ